MKQHEMLIEKYFQEFTDRYGGEVELQNNAHVLKLKGKSLRIVVSEDGKVITFYTHVCKIPDLSVEDKCELLKKLLQLNVVNLGAAFGMSEQDTILLSFSRPFADLDFSEFNFLLWALVKNLVQLMPLLQKYMGDKGQEVEVEDKAAVDREVNNRQAQVSDTAEVSSDVIPQPREGYQPEEMDFGNDGLDEFEEELIPPGVKESEKKAKDKPVETLDNFEDDFEVFEDDVESLSSPKIELEERPVKEEVKKVPADDWDEDWDF